MHVSAEIRWFWPAEPVALVEWFEHTEIHGFGAGGGNRRRDDYLIDAQQFELGLKHRGGNRGTEVKGLVAVMADGLAEAPFVGSIELWTKWTSEPLVLPPDLTISVEKCRRLRKFDMAEGAPREVPLDGEEQPCDHGPRPTVGCNVELTSVQLAGGDAWWTLGFEAFGTLHTVESALRGVVAILAARNPPQFLDGHLSSYPAWLCDRLRDS